MAKKKKTTQEKLDDLVNHKIDMLKDLAGLIQNYNELSNINVNGDDWLLGLPIEKLKDLKDTPKDTERRTRLGDLRNRYEIKKKAQVVECKLEEIDLKIKTARLTVLQEQIDKVLIDFK